jgi:hypothetical protein
MKKNKSIDVFDITNERHLGKVKLENVDQYYKDNRAKGYGVFVDHSGDICIDKENPDDDGLCYRKQIQK